MKISQMLTTESIFLNVEVNDKMAVLRFAADQFVRGGVAKSSRPLFDGMRIREEVLSTGIGGGIAIPHTASPEAGIGAVLLVRPAKPIEFDALDALPVDIVLPMVVPAEDSAGHLRLLAVISRLCRSPLFPRTVRSAETPENLLAQIKRFEENLP
jgi:mannitol/fructose-specific phosphotransferase system IIA component (Ntr-type)